MPKPETLTAVCQAHAIASVALLTRTRQLADYVRAHPFVALGDEDPDDEEGDFLAGLIECALRVAEAEAAMAMLTDLHTAAHKAHGDPLDDDEPEAEHLLRSVFTPKEPTDD